jgi:predicted nucleic acid-binding protein
MNARFLDTGYLLALELSNDQNHAAAWQHWQGVRTAPLPLLTTSYVFAEVVTYLNSRGHHAKAVQVGNSLLRSPSVELVQVDETLFHAAWTYFQRMKDKTYSLTDCVSFVIMQQRGISVAFTFDQHFVQAGFQKVP